MISVTRIDKSTPDEKVTHDGRGEAVIRVARRRRQFDGIRLWESSRQHHHTNAREQRAMRARRSLAHKALISSDPTLLRT